MAISFITDMRFTREDESQTSNVISAHDPLIWEISTNNSELTATVDIVVKDNTGATIYTSDTFNMYRYYLSGANAKFRFDATEIIKYIIATYFYKEIASFLEPENYGSELEITFKSYITGPSLEDTELVEYFGCHALNQIGDEYGSNIPRLFYNDVEEIAIFLNYPNKGFFFSWLSLAAHEPYVEIINNDIAEILNLIASWSNVNYETFTSSGTSITSAIETGVAGQCNSDTFAVIEGNTYAVLIADFTQNSGERPMFVISASSVIISNHGRTLFDGDILQLLTVTASSSSAYLSFLSTAAANFDTGPIHVRPVQDAAKDGTLGKFMHCFDIGQLTPSIKSEIMNVYYDYETFLLIKRFNLTVYNECNGIFVRFLDKNGIYFYWLFSKFQILRNESSKRGKIINAFSEMALANSRYYDIGNYESFDKIQLSSPSVPLHFRKRLMELFNSPSVDIWMPKARKDIFVKGVEGYHFYINNPVFQRTLVATNWDSAFVNSPWICKNLDGTPYQDADGYFYMYYSGSNSNTSGHPTTPQYNDDRIGLALSRDLIHWQRIEGLSATGDGCCLTWGNGDRGDGIGHISGTPSANEGFNDGNFDQHDAQIGTILFDGSQFRMWYTGNDNYGSDNLHFGHATSPDGKIWTKYASNPILGYGSGDDDDGVYGPNVFYDLEEKIWKMYYIGKKSGTNKFTFMLATSPDGLTWTRYSNNAIFSKAGNIWGPSVMKLRHDLYIMFFSNYPPASFDGLNYALSPDGITWTDKGVLVPLGTSGDWDSASTFWISPFIYKNSIYLFYRGYDGVGALPPTESAIGFVVFDEFESEWIKAEGIEGNHDLIEKRKFDQFSCDLILSERFTQKLGAIE